MFSLDDDDDDYDNTTNCDDRVQNYEQPNLKAISNQTDVVSCNTDPNIPLDIDFAHSMKRAYNASDNDQFLIISRFMIKENELTWTIKNTYLKTKTNQLLTSTTPL